jgi:hypothetical protein
MIEDVVPRFRKALFDRIKDMTDLELRVRFTSLAIRVVCRPLIFPFLCTGR